LPAEKCSKKWSCNRRRAHPRTRPEVCLRGPGPLGPPRQRGQPAPGRWATKGRAPERGRRTSRPGRRGSRGQARRPVHPSHPRLQSASCASSVPPSGEHLGDRETRGLALLRRTSSAEASVASAELLRRRTHLSSCRTWFGLAGGGFWCVVGWSGEHASSPCSTTVSRRRSPVTHD
jgi:hypothetical protein